MLWHKRTVAQSSLTPQEDRPRRIGVDHKLDYLCLPTDVLQPSSPIHPRMDGLMPLGDPSFAQAITMMLCAPCACVRDQYKSSHPDCWVRLIRTFLKHDAQVSHLCLPLRLSFVSFDRRCCSICHSVVHDLDSLLASCMVRIDGCIRSTQSTGTLARRPLFP